MSNWMELLQLAVAEEARARGVRGAIKRVASRLGVSRSAISTGMRGVYPGKTDRLEALVLSRLGGGQVMCPHLKAQISGALCTSWQTRAQPRSNPDALRHWTACRACPIAAAPLKSETAKPEQEVA